MNECPLFILWQDRIWISTVTNLSLQLPMPAILLGSRMSFSYRDIACFHPLHIFDRRGQKAILYTNESLLSGMECLGSEPKVRALGLNVSGSAASKVYQNAEMGRFLDCDKMYLYVF